MTKNTNQMTPNLTAKEKPTSRRVKKKKISGLVLRIPSFPIAISNHSLKLKSHKAVNDK